MACCGSARTAIAARSVAQAFADDLNLVLNQTVSHARLSLQSDPRAPNHFLLACFKGARVSSFDLHRSPLRLLVTHNLWVEDDEAHTASYAYRLMTSDSKDDWLLRWEYYRRPPRDGYEYPLAHCHARHGKVGIGAVQLDLNRLHIPTGRMALEHVIWHLIAEWGVASLTVDWLQILKRSIDQFESQRTSP